MLKKNFWDILAWICLFGIVLWLILKVTGIINTSLLLEYAPLFGVAYILGLNIRKLNGVAKKVDKFEHFQQATIKEINDLKLNCVRNHK